MIIGIPKEIKNRENRVAVVPGGVKVLTGAGHKVIIEKNAGVGAGISDEKYKAAGGPILDSAEKVWAQAEMIMKVKEPLASEFKYLREDQIVYTYLHLAAVPELGAELVKKRVP